MRVFGEKENKKSKCLYVKRKIYVIGWVSNADASDFPR